MPPFGPYPLPASESGSGGTPIGAPETITGSMVVNNTLGIGKMALLTWGNFTEINANVEAVAGPFPWQTTPVANNASAIRGAIKAKAAIAAKTVLGKVAAGNAPSSPVKIVFLQGTATKSYKITTAGNLENEEEIALGAEVSFDGAWYSR